jgi:perosamine synthetase
MIPIYKPFLNEKNLQHAHKAIDSTWISSVGDYLDLSKNKLKEITNSKYVVLTNNGTTATHLLALGLKFKYPNINRIIVPNNVYVAAWNSFLFGPKYKLIPIDADLDTWNYKLDEIEKHLDENTAILAVHNIGNIIDVPKLKERFPNTPILEDNCEGFLGKYTSNGQLVYSGTESLISSISFFGNKTITCGEGGAVFIQDEDLFEYINNIKSQGQSNIRYIHDNLGYNYRMTNIQASLLYGQMEDLEAIVTLKENVVNEYKKVLNPLVERGILQYQKIEDGTKHSQWMFAVRFPTLSSKVKKELELYLYSNSIESRPMFYSIKNHTHLKKIKCDTTNADILNSQCLILPSYPELSISQIYYIGERIIKFFDV